MRIIEGRTAIDFNVMDLNNQNITLSDYKGKKVLVSFYRYASCPLCNLRISELIENNDILMEKDLCLIAFFQSPKESILRYVGQQSVPFPIIADPERIIYKKYGIETSLMGMIKVILKPIKLLEAMNKGFKPGKMEGSKSLLPADFLIDLDQKIVKAYYGKDIGDHLPIEDILKYLE